MCHWQKSSPKCVEFVNFIKSRVFMSKERHRFIVRPPEVKKEKKKRNNSPRNVFIYFSDILE